MTGATTPPLPHAVARLRAERLTRAVKPFVTRGGPAERCPVCRVMHSHCLCHLRPQVATHAGVCLLMADIEPLKPSNTGWLIADVVADTFAFGWARTWVDPALLTLLADPQWQPYVVFPGEFVAPARVVTALLPPENVSANDPDSATLDPHRPVKRPLFVLLDGTWAEAGKMFRKSPYLNHLPVLSLEPDQVSNYRLRRSSRGDHFCTSEVGALCLALAGEPRAADVLAAYLDVFTYHYLQAKNQQPLNWGSAAHQRFRQACAFAASASGAATHAMMDDANSYF